MYDNVLVPIDRGIKSNEDCLKEAQRLVAPGGTIHCVFVHLEQVEDHVSADAYEDKPVKLAKERLAGAGVNYETLTRTGQPAQEIAQYANQNPIDVVVMNTYNRSGIKKLITGSVTEDTIDQASCPVLVLTND